MRLFHPARWTAAVVVATVLVMPARSSAQSAIASEAATPSQRVSTEIAPPTVIAPSVNVSTPAAPTEAAGASAATRAPLAAQPRGVAIGRYTMVDSTTPPVPAPANNNHGNTALMLVGAGTMIVGAIVGGDAGTIILLGGAALGIFGLYRYLTN